MFAALTALYLWPGCPPSLLGFASLVAFVCLLIAPWLPSEKELAIKRNTELLEELTCNYEARERQEQAAIDAARDENCY